MEPFAGSASLFFKVQPDKALLGDINESLIQTFEQVKSNVSAVFDSLQSFGQGRDEYLKIRQVDPESLDPALRAARFIYLNRFCFNGLYRTNRAGTFNVPYGGEKSGSLPTIDMLTKCSALLRNADLIAGDYETTLNQCGRGDFIYMDPPYRVDARRTFNEYDQSHPTCSPTESPLGLLPVTHMPRELLEHVWYLR